MTLTKAEQRFLTKLSKLAGGNSILTTQKALCVDLNMSSVAGHLRSLRAKGFVHYENDKKPKPTLIQILRNE